jgi:hypothetical protein
MIISSVTFSAEFSCLFLILCLCGDMSYIALCYPGGGGGGIIAVGLIGWTLGFISVATLPDLLVLCVNIPY